QEVVRRQLVRERQDRLAVPRLDHPQRQRHVAQGDLSRKIKRLARLRFHLLGYSPGRSGQQTPEPRRYAHRCVLSASLRRAIINAGYPGDTIKNTSLVVRIAGRARGELTLTRMSTISGDNPARG